MGTRNRERRKAKQKAHAAAGRRHRPAGPPFGPAHDDAPTAVGAAAKAMEHYFDHAVVALDRDDPTTMDHFLRGLVTGPRLVVNATAVGLMEHLVGLAWRRGWQPADIARAAERRRGAAHAGIAVDMIASELRRYAAGTVEARWDEQLRSLGAGVWWGDEMYLDAWCERYGADRRLGLTCVVEVMHLLRVLPDIGRLCPLPGEARRGSLHPDQGAGRPVDHRMLGKVRGLLAKAESTQFAEEAEALMAKAQELMARHSIDYALLAVRTGETETPIGIRVGIDNPYESAKSLLLSRVAAANRCRAVWSKSWGFETVMGFAADVEAVELLYTSLLVQATTAAVAAGSRRDEHGRSRTRSFRQSFLDAYAIRIGQRLAEATGDVSREASKDDDRLLPVLAAREDAVGKAFEEMFPGMVYSAVGVSNREGWVSGTAAADLATLHARRAVTVP